MVTTKENPIDDTVDQLVARAMSELHVPGLALAVIDGENYWAKVLAIITGYLVHSESTSS